MFENDDFELILKLIKPPGLEINGGFKIKIIFD